MKAAIYDTYGPASVVKLRDIPRPEPKADEILVRVNASAVSTADWRLRAAAFPNGMWLLGRLFTGLFRPRNRILGTDFAGRVEAAGPAVHEFRPGDSVFGFSGNGGHAEYLTIAASGPVALRPLNLTPQEAAAVPFGAVSALVFLRDVAKLQPGEKILINGASGGVGVFAVQLAKHFGAEVTAVASQANHALLRDLGADHLIDYKTHDFARSGKTWDVILDTVGTTTWGQARAVLTSTGRYVPLEFGLGAIARSLVANFGSGPKFRIAVSGDKPEDVRLIADLLTAGTIRPVIDSVHTLDHITDAHLRVESRHKTGAVVVAIAA